MSRLHYGFASNDCQAEFMAIERGLSDIKQRFGKPQSSFESELIERLGGFSLPSVPPGNIASAVRIFYYSIGGSLAFTLT